MITVKDVEAKKSTLEAELNTALLAAKVLVPATPEFDEAYGRYLAAKANLLKIPDEIKAAKLSENADAIKAVSIAAGTAIDKLIEGLKIADLLGSPVTAMRYAKDTAGAIIIVFNPVTTVKSSGPKVAGEKKAGGHNMIVTPTGERLSLTKFVGMTATEAEKQTAEFKYPHVQVQTKPKFEAYCTAHNLTGYTYELPNKAS